MRIGEMAEAVQREHAARLAAMAGETTRIAADLLETPEGAVAPSVRMGDSVRISAEAREVQSRLPAVALPIGPYPAPGEIIDVFREMLSAPSRGAERAASERLAGLIARLAHGFRLAASNFPAGTGAEVADALARALGSGKPEGMRQAGPLLRELLATVAPSGPNAGSTATPANLERAAAALFLAALRVGADAGAAQPVPPMGAPERGLPPALLGWLAPAAAAQRSPGAKVRKRSVQDEDDGGEQDKDSNDGHGRTGQPDSALDELD